MSCECLARPRTGSLELSVQLLGIGDQADRHDVTADGCEASDRKRPPARSHDEARGAVDDRGPDEARERPAADEN
jgi:hypothetical protein